MCAMIEMAATEKTLYQEHKDWIKGLYDEG